MADEPTEVPEPRIPEPKIEVAVADTLAASEVVGFASGRNWQLTQTRWDWLLRISYRFVLFFFVLGINVWWSGRVICMVRRSGLAGSDFHLDNSVLIALVTTSIANFLALVVIVARHLFPTDSSK